MKKLIKIIFLLSFLISISVSANDKIAKSVATLKADGSVELKITDVNNKITILEIKKQDLSFSGIYTPELIKKLSDLVKVDQVSAKQELILNPDGTQVQKINDGNGNVVVITADKGESINAKVMDYIVKHPLVNSQPKQQADNPVTKTATKPEEPTKK